MMATGRLPHKIPSSLMVAGARVWLGSRLLKTAGTAGNGLCRRHPDIPEFIHVARFQFRGHAVFHPIQDFIEPITLFGFDEQINLAARVMILQNPLFFHLFVL